ncbi:MAG: HAD hydrolase-like protein [Alphaproteobacteria bacterium]|nr:HAD hydrolase-like protein [Alphaproteobacteria bacterium]
MIYNSLNDIADRFDVFLFDAYGVFWEGNGFYKNSRETMENLVKKGKIVVVISNTTALGPDIRQSYAKRGLFEHKEYNYMITSGDLLRSHLVAGDLSFKSCSEPLKYYVIGLPHYKAFANTKYLQVETPEEADFVYCGVPFVFPSDVAAYPQYADLYWPVHQDENGKIDIWDTLTEKPFEKIVNKAVELNLPVLNANPDFTAREGHPLVPNSESVFVVRNGTIAEMFRQRGAEVYEFGKPHANIYDYTFHLLENEGIRINKKRTCMIGDTVRTDVKGAMVAGVAPVLCVKTGVTAEDIANGESLENLCNSEKIDIKQIIKINAVGGL